MVGVEKGKRAGLPGIVEKKRPFKVRPGQKRLPNMERAGADNSVSYHQRASVVLFLRKAQQFVRHCKRVSVRGSRRVEGPLTKEHGKELVGFTELLAQLAGPSVRLARLRRRLTLERVQGHPQRNLQVKFLAVALWPFRPALEQLQTHSQLRGRLGHRRAGDRLLPSLVPIMHRRFD